MEDFVLRGAEFDGGDKAERAGDTLALMTKRIYGNIIINGDFFAFLPSRLLASMNRLPNAPCECFA